MASTRGFHAIAADWLAIRRPTRLAVDGLCLVIVSAFLGILYEALMYDEARREAVSSFYSHVFRPSNGVSLASSACYYTGWTVIAIACARVVGEQVRKSAPESTETP